MLEFQEDLLLDRQRGRGHQAMEMEGVASRGVNADPLL